MFNPLHVLVVDAMLLTFKVDFLHICHGVLFSHSEAAMSSQNGATWCASDVDLHVRLQVRQLTEDLGDTLSRLFAQASTCS